MSSQYTLTASQWGSYFWQSALMGRTSWIPNNPKGLNHKMLSAACHAWDEEIEHIRETLWTARMRRNAIAPSCLLPPEILAHIFQFLAVLCPIDYGNNDGYLGWISVTHVCRQWRGVALSHATLWSHFKIGHALQPRGLMLERAGSAPLHVTGEIFQGRDLERTKGFIIGQLHRMGSLNVQTSHEELVDIVSNMNRLLPLMQSFSITRYNVNDMLHLSLLSNFFSTNAQTIQSIYLSGYSFPWGVTLPNVRSMTIIGRGFHSLLPDPLFTFKDVVNGLKHLPALENLDLSYILPPIPPRTEKHAPIPLPMLRNLELNGSTTTCIALRKLIELASDASVKINAFEVSDSDWDHIVSEMTQWFKSPAAANRPVFRYLLIEQTGSLEFYLGCASCDGGVRHEYDDSCNQPSFSLELKDANFERDPVILSYDLSSVAFGFTQCMSPAQLNDLESLCVFDCTDWPKDRIEKLYGQAASLKELHVSGDDPLCRWFEALSPGGATDQTLDLNNPDSASVETPLLLPLLDTLVIHCRHVSTKEQVGLALTRMCKERAQSGRQIRKLELKDGTIDQSTLDELKSLVLIVEHGDIVEEGDEDESEDQVDADGGEQEDDE